MTDCTAALCKKKKKMKTKLGQSFYFIVCAEILKKKATIPNFNSAAQKSGNYGRLI